MINYRMERYGEKMFLATYSTVSANLPGQWDLWYDETRPILCPFMSKTRMARAEKLTRGA
jgi:hypothetical protein